MKSVKTYTIGDNLNLVYYFLGGDYYYLVFSFSGSAQETNYTTLLRTTLMVQALASHGTSLDKTDGCRWYPPVSSNMASWEIRKKIDSGLVCWEHFMAKIILFLFLHCHFWWEGTLPMPFHGISWNYHWSYQWCHQPSHKASVDSWGNSKLSNQLGPDQRNVDKVIGLIPYPWY